MTAAPLTKGRIVVNVKLWGTKKCVILGMIYRKFNKRLLYIVINVGILILKLENVPNAIILSVWNVMIDGKKKTALRKN